MEDGEGGEDESMQDEAEEGRRHPFRKSENQPSSHEVQEHMKTHIPYRSWCAHCVRGRGMIPTGQEEEGEDQEIIHTSQLTSDSSKRVTLMIRQIRGANPVIGPEAKYGLTLAMAVPRKGNAAPWIAKRVADWLDSLGSQTVTLKCDNEPAIFSLLPRRFGGSGEKVASPSSSTLRKERSRATILLRAA